MPVSAKTALATAGANGGTPGSPTPAGWRVLGYFVWMLGAGVVLDSDRLVTGRLLLAVGAALFAAGVWQSARGARGQR